MELEEKYSIAFCNTAAAMSRHASNLYRNWQADKPPSIQDWTMLRNHQRCFDLEALPYLARRNTMKEINVRVKLATMLAFRALVSDMCAIWYEVGEPSKKQWKELYFVLEKYQNVFAEPKKTHT